MSHEDFIRRFLNPEDLGLAVPAHVRDSCREQLGMPAVDGGPIANPIPAMREFICRWADVINGGDWFDALEGWAREFVIEAGEVTSQTKGV